MKSKIAVLFSVACCFFLASCATLTGPREFEIPLVKLQQELDKKFPFNNRYLEILNINLSNPKLVLQPDTHRIMATMDAVVAPFFVKKKWVGSMSFSGGLKFDAARNAVTLNDVNIENFYMDGVDAANSKQIEKVGRLLADQMLQNVPLYTFRPEDLRYGGTNFFVSKIITKSNALVVTFEPVK